MTMQVNGPSHIHGPQPLRAPHRIRPAEAQPSVDYLYGADQVDISREAELLSHIHDLPEIRADRVEQIRTELADGVYETDEKLEVAVGRLLDELLG
jgi:hypothetical protein